MIEEVIPVIEVIRVLSIVAIPAFMVFVLIYGHIRGVNVYDTFIEGAKEGLSTVLRIFPYMVAMFVAIGIFRTSGAMDVLVRLLSPLANLVGIPAEMLPLALMRPISGMASTGILGELYKTYGPDSFIGRAASTMMGSTETTFYTISIYLGSIGYKDARYILAAGLLADFTGFAVSLLICTLLFGR